MFVFLLVDIMIEILRKYLYLLFFLFFALFSMSINVEAMLVADQGAPDKIIPFAFATSFADIFGERIRACTFNSLTLLAIR